MAGQWEQNYSYFILRIKRILSCINQFIRGVRRSKNRFTSGRMRIYLDLCLSSKRVNFFRDICAILSAHILRVCVRNWNLIKQNYNFDFSVNDTDFGAFGFQITIGRVIINQKKPTNYLHVEIVIWKIIFSHRETERSVNISIPNARLRLF